jgi:EAL domain-containing protein (putative c-di-GMP-specific phosphodiesterase class I)
MGSTVIAEGIETDAELRALRALGVDSAQGYLLGRPTTSHKDWLAWSRPTHPPVVREVTVTEER